MMNFSLKVILFQILLSSFIVSSCFGNALPETNSLPVLNIECKDITLKDFIDKVSMESGYKIIVSEELLVDHLTGTYKNVNLEQLFHKIFRKHNVFQIIDTGKKELHIYTDLKNTHNVYASQPVSESKSTRFKIDGNTIEVRPGVTLNQVRKNRDELAKKIETNAIQIDGDGAPVYSERKETRKQLSQDIANGDIVVDLGQGRTLQDSITSRKELSKQIESGNIEMEDSGRSLEEVRQKRAEFARKLQSGEIEITEDY